MFKDNGDATILFVVTVIVSTYLLLGFFLGGTTFLSGMWTKEDCRSFKVGHLVVPAKPVACFLDMEIYP